MFIKAEEVSERKVRYINKDGSSVIFSGGNRTWRNQNPGDIGAGPWANRHGAIGAAGKPKKKSKFAVFPDYGTGRAAIFSLLQSPGYINQTIWDAMGWISKSMGIQLARQGKIDAVVATSKSGNLFLRTRPGTPVEIQLDNLG